MHKLLALNQRQKMVATMVYEFDISIVMDIIMVISVLTYMLSFQVLQRKTEEASMATKRLKELLESRKTSRETSSNKEVYASF